MKITLPSPDEFVFKPCEVAGEKCVLITPTHLGQIWTKQTLIFRSSIWTVDGFPVSLSFKKFFNWGEKPELAYTPFSLTANGGVDLLEKLDGSTLIVSRYKGQLIVRTRGTVDASTLDNGHEIALLKARYPKAFEYSAEATWPFSLIFEWTSPINQIVIKYGDEPNMALIGIIKHEDYSLTSQSDLDKHAEVMGVPRPRRFDFTSIKQMLGGVEKLVGQEGICCYCNKGQDIRKVKSAWYLALHALKSNLTTDKLAEMWFLWEQPSYEAFVEKFTSTFDYEAFQFAQKVIAALFDGVREYKTIMAHLQKFYEENKGLPRKDFALKARQSYGDTKKFGMLMNLYSGKEPKREAVKHILLQNTKQYELGLFGRKNKDEETGE